MQNDLAPGHCKPLFDDAGMMVARVVEKDVDETHRGMRAFNLAQELDGALRVDLIDGEDLCLAGLQIDGVGQFAVDRAGGGSLRLRDAVPDQLQPRQKGQHVAQTIE